MKVEIKEVPEMRVAFVRHVGPYEECSQAWEKLLAWAGPSGLLGGGTRFIGVSHDDPEVTASDKNRYDACITIDAGVEAPVGIAIRTVGGGRFAMATHNGPYEKLSETYAALCGQWAPQSSHELRSMPCLEEYLNTPSETEPEDLLTDVYIPIE